VKSDAEIEAVIEKAKEGYSLIYASSLLGWKSHDFYKARKHSERLENACLKQRQRNIEKSRLDIDSTPFPKKKKATVSETVAKVIMENPLPKGI